MSPTIEPVSTDIRQLLDPGLSIEARGVLGWLIAGGGDPFAWAETYKVACAVAELAAAGYVREAAEVAP